MQGMIIYKEAFSPLPKFSCTLPCRMSCGVAGRLPDLPSSGTQIYTLVGTVSCTDVTR